MLGRVTYTRSHAGSGPGISSCHLSLTSALIRFRFVTRSFLRSLLTFFFLSHFLCYSILLFYIAVFSEVQVIEKQTERLVEVVQLHPLEKVVDRLFESIQIQDQTVNTYSYTHIRLSRERERDCFDYIERSLVFLTLYRLMMSGDPS